MTMVPVRGDHRILRRNGRIGPGYNGFLADVEVAKAFDFLLAIELSTFFFKTPHQKHVVKPFLGLCRG